MSSTIQPIKYIFDLSIRDNLWKDSIVAITLFSITMISITQLGKFFEVKNNWQRMRCRPEVMAFAWMYGKNTQNNMEYCLENAGLQVKQSNIVAPTVKKIETGYNDLNSKINNTKAVVSELDKKLKDASKAINGQNKNMATGVYQNILALKEGMQKVIAGLVIQNQMSNGVLRTTSGTKALTDSLRKSLNKVPTVAK